MGLELRHRCHPFLSSRAERGDLGCHPFLSSRGTKRSRLSSFPVIASGAWRSRLILVIARNVAISVVHSQQTEKSEIASQARNDRYKLSSRAQYFCHRERSVAISPNSCHRERSVAISPISCHRERSVAISVVILSYHRERSVAISVVQGQQTEKREIASQARNDRYKLSTRAQYFCHREGRSDLGCSGPANRQKRDCFASSQ